MRQREHLVDPASSETLACAHIFCSGTGRSPLSPSGIVRWAALGRREPKPMMHEEEKSDLPIVPVKPVNNAASAVAESVEGSGGTKRNAGQQSTDRTQCRKTVSQAQARIREAVSRNSKEKLTTLLHHVTVDALKSAFFNLKKRAAAGVDDVSWLDYAADLDRNLTDLHARVQRGAYRALPSRRVYIPKSDGKLRPLGIAAMEDKLVQAAVVMILTPVYEAEFLGFSYGFRRRGEARLRHDGAASTTRWTRSRSESRHAKLVGFSTQIFPGSLTRSVTIGWLNSSVTGLATRGSSA